MQFGSPVGGFSGGAGLYGAAKPQYSSPTPSPNQFNHLLQQYGAKIENGVVVIGSSGGVAHSPAVHVAHSGGHSGHHHGGHHGHAVVYGSGQVKQLKSNHVKKDKARKQGQVAQPQSTSDMMGPYAALVTRGEGECVYRYDFCTKTEQWIQTVLMVKFEKIPFAEGGLRRAFKATDMTKPPGQGEFVAKSYKTSEPSSTYINDIEMQSVCEKYAEKYNKRGAPKKVKYLHAWLLERFTKTNRPLLCCEDVLPGKFGKFNNNDGYISEDDKNTPQAFSHFTYSISKNQLMVVDIQGSTDGGSFIFTDPQIHTADGRGYGKGNMGAHGMHKFMGTHKCNSICVGLQLVPKHAQRDFEGTMMEKQIKPVDDDIVKA